MNEFIAWVLVLLGFASSIDRKAARVEADAAVSVAMAAIQSRSAPAVTEPKRASATHEQLQEIRRLAEVTGWTVDQQKAYLSGPKIRKERWPELSQEQASHLIGELGRYRTELDAVVNSKTQATSGGCVNGSCQLQGRRR